MPSFDRHTDDPIQQKIDQIKHISSIGKALNERGVWKLTMDFAKLGETAHIHLFRKSDTTGQAILQTTVYLRPEMPLTTEHEHQFFQDNLREHLNGVIALIQVLTKEPAPKIDAMTQQNNLIGVIDK